MFARWWDNFQESCDIRLAVGCGCAVAWVLLVAISPVLSTASTFIGAGLSWRSGIVVGGVLAFGLAAIACRRPGKLCDVERRSPSVPPLAMSAVLSPIGAILHQSIAGGIFAVVAGLCVGCGLAGLILGWAAPFSAVRLRKRVVATVAAMFAGGALYLIVVLLPAPLSFAVALALAPTSLFLAMTIDRFPAPGDETDSFPTIGGTTETGAENGGGKAEADTIAAAEAETRPCSSAGHPDLTRLFGPELSLAIVVYGALFVLAGHVLPEVELAWMASVLPGIANVGALLVSETVLTLYLVKRIRIESPRTAYRPATALVAVGFLLLPFVGDAGAIPCMAVAFAGFGCFLVYLWIVMGNMAQRWSAAPIPTCAFGFMLLFSGIVLGELAAWHPLPRPPQLRLPGGRQHRLAVHARRACVEHGRRLPLRPRDRRDGRRALLCPSFIKRRDGFRFRRQRRRCSSAALCGRRDLRPVAARGGGDGAPSAGALHPLHLRRAVHRQEHRADPRAPHLRQDEHHRRPPRAHRPHRGLRLVTVPAMPSAKSVSRTEQPLSQKPEYRV